MRLAPALLALLLAAPARPAPAKAGKGWNWRETTVIHFRIYHQNRLPPGLVMEVERMHTRLRMDLGMFSPWMAKEKISLFIYKDLESFVGGEFSPPPWSNGIAVYDEKAVAVPTMRELPQMLRVLAHETTHLLFVSYFREQKRDPPHWLNEGLAMVEEAEAPDRPETSLWYQNMAGADPSSWFPMDRFFEISPTKDIKKEDKAEVANWYLQAYSVVHFLLRKHSRLQFKSFCAMLREGRPVRDALWRVYRYRTPADFERRWKAWLEDPAHKRRVLLLAASQQAKDDGVIEKDAGPGKNFTPFSTGRALIPVQEGPAGAARPAAAGAN